MTVKTHNVITLVSHKQCAPRLEQLCLKLEMVFHSTMNIDQKAHNVISTIELAKI